MGALALQDRRAPAQSTEHPPAAAMVIDGEIVLVDLDVGPLSGREPCVVIRGDGTIGIETPRNSLKFWCTGRRGGYYDIFDNPESRDGRASVACVIVGKVIPSR